MIKLFIFFFSILISQEKNIDYYITSLINGDPEEAILNLNRLEDSYGSIPEVLYLKALLDKDGKGSMLKFKEMYNKFPNNQYSDNAVVKVAEYYYALGLYIQSADWFEKIPKYYPRSETLEQSLIYLFNCWIIIGDKKKAQHKLKVFKRQFPNLDIAELSSLEVFDLVPSNDISLNTNVDKSIQNNVKEIIDNNEAVLSEKEESYGDWTVQVGAYLDLVNASRQKNLIENLGFFVNIKKKKFKSGKIVYYVLVGNYTEDKARSTSAILKSDYGIDTFIKKIN